MGATVGARIGVAPSQTDEHDTIDGEMSYRVFQLMQLHDQRVLAVLVFIVNKKFYFSHKNVSQH